MNQVNHSAPTTPTTHVCHASHFGLRPMLHLGKTNQNQTIKDHIQKLDGISCLQQVCRVWGAKVKGWVLVSAETVSFCWWCPPIVKPQSINQKEKKKPGLNLKVPLGPENHLRHRSTTGWFRSVIFSNSTRRCFCTNIPLICEYMVTLGHSDTQLCNLCVNFSQG